MNELKFDNLEYLHLLWVVVGVGLVFAYGFARKRGALRKFLTSDLYGRLLPDVSVSKQRIKAVLVVLTLVGLVGAIIGPRYGVVWEDVQRKGIDIVVALDASRSMLARDVTPSRLESAKQDIRDLLTVVPGDRVGLVTFAGKAVLKCPLTIDYGFYRMILDEVDVESAPRGGTNIEDAIRLAVDCFDDKIQKHKAVIIVTDGEDHEGDPVGAAAEAYQEHGIRVYTIGLGDVAEGQRIPMSAGGQVRYVQHEGEQVWSKMNPRLLQEIAKGGVCVPAGTQWFSMEEFYNTHVAGIEKREYQNERRRQHIPRYQWCLAVALGLLLIESLMSERKGGKDRSEGFVG